MAQSNVTNGQEVPSATYVSGVNIYSLAIVLHKDVDALLTIFCTHLTAPTDMVKPTSEA